MNIADLITGDGETTEEVKHRLARIKNALTLAARDYAQEALNASNRALNEAMSGSPCAKLYTDFVRAKLYRERAQAAVAAGLDAAQLQAACDQTEDSEVNEANLSFLLKQMELASVEAILEGVGTRLGLTARTLPEKIVPGALCDPTRLNPTPPEQPDSGEEVS